MAKNCKYAISFILSVIITLLSPSLIYASFAKYSSSPVLSIGNSGSWDDNSVTNAKIMFDDGVYKMWYYGNHTDLIGKMGYATSYDGSHWIKSGNYIVSKDPSDSTEIEINGPRVYKFGNVYKMWYSSVASYTGSGSEVYRIKYATSPNGIDWTPMGFALRRSGQAWDEEGVVPSTILFINGEYRMWYGARDANGHWSIGYARSLNELSGWTPNTSPIMIPTADDGFSLGVSTVIYDEINNNFHMYFHTGSLTIDPITLNPINGPPNKIWHAISPNGITDWVKDPNPIFISNPSIINGSSFDDKLIASPEVIKVNNTYLMYYCGHNGYNWQIGLATDGEFPIPSPSPSPSPTHIIDLYANTTSSCYMDLSSGNWTNVHDALYGNVSYNPTLCAGSSALDGNYWINRSFFSIPTSGISGSLSSAFINFYPTLTQFGTGGLFQFYEATQADDYSEVPGDWSQCSNTELLKEDITSSNTLPNTYSAHELNTAGLAYLNRSGNTKICFKNKDFDALNVIPTINGEYHRIFFNIGTESNPLFLSTYGEPAPTPETTPTPTPEPTPNSTPTPSPSPTPVSTPSSTPSPTSTPSPSPTPTPTPTLSPSPSPSSSPSPTSSPSPSSSPTPSPTPPTKKVILVPGVAASWNADAIMNCKSGNYSGSWNIIPVIGSQIYQPAMDALTNANYTVIPYYYDWRLSIDANGEHLEEFINQNTLPDEKVNIIGHSMGGLVGRAYLEHTKLKNKIDKFLTIGSPHLGSPQAYYAWAGGEIVGDLNWRIYGSFVTFICGIRNRTINPRLAVQQYIPSVQNTLPVFEYLRYQNSPGYKSLVYMKNLNNWLPTHQFPPFYGAHVATLAGIGQTTMNDIVVRNPTASETRQGNWLDGRPVKDEYISEGDGTVLLKSSEMEADQNFRLSLNHSQLMNDPSAILQIINYLKGSEGNTASFNISSNSLSSEKPALAIISSQAVLKATKPDGSVVKDQNGVIILSDTQTGNYTLKLQPLSWNSKVYIGQFLKSGEIKWREYGFSNPLPKTRTLKYNPSQITDDILK